MTKLKALLLFFKVMVVVKVKLAATLYCSPMCRLLDRLLDRGNGDTGHHLPDRRHVCRDDVTSAGSRDHAHATSVDVGCGQLMVDDVWVSGFAKLMTESALRLLDVNGDGVLHVLLGFYRAMLAQSAVMRQ